MKSPDNRGGTGPLLRWLERAVPLLSFGGAFLAIAFLISGAEIDARVTILGCVGASVVLAYLAWIRPKKDIVALSTPIYSLIFIAVPTDNLSTAVLEVLYAVSLTVLLLRLKARFGSPGTPVSALGDLAEPLKGYVTQGRPASQGVNTETAHQATRVFVRFTAGDYGEAARIAESAATELGPGSGFPVLARAFGIVSEQATCLERSLSRPAAFRTFLPGDEYVLARAASPSAGKEQEYYLALDNALLLLFSVGWNASPADHNHLLATQGFALKLMESAKRPE